MGMLETKKIRGSPTKWPLVSPNFAKPSYLAYILAIAKEALLKIGTGITNVAGL